MPIEDIKPHNDCNTIKTKSGCNADYNRLNALIKKEAEVREKEDEYLQKQIDGKLDNIKFIYVYSLSGTLESELLNLLIENRVNRLVYNDVIYYLSLIGNPIRKYCSRIQSVTYNEIDVNIQTGDYVIIQTMDPRIREHIDDTNVHVTPDEKAFWNKKVSASVEQIGTEDDNRLILTNK